MPPGAAVVEGGNVLGVTPIGVVVDNASVAASPRRFVLRHPGFLPFELSAAASDEASVRTVATLVAEEAPAPPTLVAPNPARPPRVDPRGGRRPSRPPANPAVDSDIRMHR